MDYREDSGTFHDKVAKAKGQRQVVYLDRGDVDTSMFTEPKLRSSHDSGKGVRIQVNPSCLAVRSDFD